MDADATPKNQVPATMSAAFEKSPDTREIMRSGKLADLDAILSWVLYSLGSNFLVAGDIDFVLQILEILRPIDGNLAELLTAKLYRSA